MSGKDRQQQCVWDRFADSAPEFHIGLQIPVVADSVAVSGRITANITKSSRERTIELKTSSLQNLLPMVPRVFNERARKAVEGLCAIYNGSTVDVMD